MSQPGGSSTPPQSQFRVNFLSRTFRAFQYRDFRLIWAGAFTSTVGTWTQVVAQGWLVLELSDSAFVLGLMAFLAELPFILFTLVGGAIADRVDRRKQLLTSQYIQMSSAFVLTGLVYFDVIVVWHFLVLVFVVGSGQAFGAPAYHSLLPSLVRREDMPNAIAMNSIQFNLARVIGPLLAGLLLKNVGPVFCFALNGVTFVAVITSLYIIKSNFQPQKSGRSVVKDIGHGFSFLVSHGALWQLSILGFISAFCATPLLTMLPVIARDTFGLDSGGYSTMMSFSGAGAVCGGLLYAGLSHARRRGLEALTVQLAFSIFLAVFALSTWLPLSYGLLFLGGISMMMLVASINSLVQLATSDEMRGRVTSIFMLCFRGGMPLGNLLTGSLAVQFSPQDALMVNAALLGTTAVVFLVAGSSVKKL